MSLTASEIPCSNEVLLLRLAIGVNLDAGDMAQLSAAERERMASYKDPLRAARFCIARTALRRVLAQRLQCEPAQVRLLQTAHGKPYAPDMPQLHFSVSYDRQHAFVALCQTRILGLDVQHLSLRRFETVRKFILDGGGNSDSATNPARVWTRMEAYAKMVGTGLHAGPHFLLAVALGRSPAAMPHQFVDVELDDAAVSVCVAGLEPVRLSWGVF
jgi:4'-phosphopantetheinyl transferase